MRYARLMIALLLALSLGLGPVFAGTHKASAAAMQDCMGKVKCPCDKGSSSCVATACKLACGGVIGILVTIDQTQEPSLVVAFGASEFEPRTVELWSDPPIPRA